MHFWYSYIKTNNYFWFIYEIYCVLQVGFYDVDINRRASTQVTNRLLAISINDQTYTAKISFSSQD